MTNVVEIPLTPATAQAFSIALGDITYQMTFRFNQYAEVWMMDLATGEGAPLISGMSLVTGEDLLYQHQHLGIPGQLVVQTDHDSNLIPTFVNLGVAGRVYYVEAA